MSTTPRGSGRAAMIEAAADALLAGREVKVLDVAEQAGVRHTLIYRHFPAGGRDELVAEAYAKLFQGQVAHYLALLESHSTDLSVLREQLRADYRATLEADRDDMRWARLEALAKARVNPYVADRLDAARDELVDLAVKVLTDRPGWRMDQRRTRAFALVVLSVPLGLTAMLGPQASESQRHDVADMWADLVVSWLASDQ